MCFDRLEGDLFCGEHFGQRGLDAFARRARRVSRLISLGSLQRVLIGIPLCGNPFFCKLGGTAFGSCARVCGRFQFPLRDAACRRLSFQGGFRLGQRHCGRFRFQFLFNTRHFSCLCGNLGVDPFARKFCGGAVVFGLAFSFGAREPVLFGGLFGFGCGTGVGRHARLLLDTVQLTCTR